MEERSFYAACSKVLAVEHEMVDPDCCILYAGPNGLWRGQWDGLFHYKCLRAAVVEVDGTPYCALHAPKVDLHD